MLSNLYTGAQPNTQRKERLNFPLRRETLNVNNSSVTTSAAQRQSSTISVGRLAKQPPGYSFRALTTSEKKMVHRAITQAITDVDRSIVALTKDWYKRVPGSSITQRNLFAQYFGVADDAARREVLGRLKAIKARLTTYAKAPDIGAHIERVDKRIERIFGSADPATGRIYVGPGFFTASNRPGDFDTQAGVLVHEISHVTYHAGSTCVDINDKGKQIYKPLEVRKMANETPAAARKHANTIEWYVEREK
jgi:hypothetical protein